MDEINSWKRMYAFAAGSFHATLLMLLLITVLYSSGNLNGFLEQLDTLPGLGIFLLLWGSSWISAQQWLDPLYFSPWKTQLGQFPWDGHWRMKPANLLGGLLWGGLNGSLFLFSLSLASGITVSLSKGETAPLINAVFFGVFGVIPAFFVGMVVGCLALVIHWAMFSVTRAISSRGHTSKQSSSSNRR